VPRTQVLVESVIFETTASDGFDFSFAAGILPAVRLREGSILTVSRLFYPALAVPLVFLTGTFWGLA
jgi:hypothetical protein